MKDIKYFNFSDKNLVTYLTQNSNSFLLKYENLTKRLFGQDYVINSSNLLKLHKLFNKEFITEIPSGSDVFYLNELNISNSFKKEMMRNKTKDGIIIKEKRNSNNCNLIVLHADSLSTASYNYSRATNFDIIDKVNNGIIDNKLKNYYIKFDVGNHNQFKVFTNIFENFFIYYLNKFNIPIDQIISNEINNVLNTLIQHTKYSLGSTNDPHINDDLDDNQQYEKCVYIKINNYEYPELYNLVIKEVKNYNNSIPDNNVHDLQKILIISGYNIYTSKHHDFIDAQRSVVIKDQLPIIKNLVESVENLDENLYSNKRGNLNLISEKNYISSLKNLKNSMKMQEFHYIMKLLDNNDTQSLGFEILYSYNHKDNDDILYKTYFIIQSYRDVIAHEIALNNNNPLYNTNKELFHSLNQMDYPLRLRDYLHGISEIDSYLANNNLINHFTHLGGILNCKINKNFIEHYTSITENKYNLLKIKNEIIQNTMYDYSISTLLSKNIDIEFIHYIVDKIQNFEKNIKLIENITYNNLPNNVEKYIYKYGIFEIFTIYFEIFIGIKKIKLYSIDQNNLKNDLKDLNEEDYDKIINSIFNYK